MRLLGLAVLTLVALVVIGSVVPDTYVEKDLPDWLSIPLAVAAVLLLLVSKINSELLRYSQLTPPVAHAVSHRWNQNDLRLILRFHAAS